MTFVANHMIDLCVAIVVQILNISILHNTTVQHLRKMLKYLIIFVESLIPNQSSIHHRYSILFFLIQVYLVVTRCDLYNYSVNLISFISELDHKIGQKHIKNVAKILQAYCWTNAAAGVGL